QTSFVNSTQLTATIPESVALVSSTVNISLENIGAYVSNQVSYQLTPGPLSLRSLTPNSWITNGPGILITLAGVGFSKDCLVDFNGAPLSTTYINGTQLIAGFPTNVYHTPMVGNMRVRCDPNVSNTLPFTLTAQPLTNSEYMWNTGSGNPGVAV